jgi:hypothetical protein
MTLINPSSTSPSKENKFEFAYRLEKIENEISLFKTKEDYMTYIDRQLYLVNFNNFQPIPLNKDERIKKIFEILIASKYYIIFMNENNIPSKTFIKCNIEKSRDLLCETLELNVVKDELDGYFIRCLIVYLNDYILYLKTLQE